MDLLLEQEKTYQALRYFQAKRNSEGVIALRRRLQLLRAKVIEEAGPEMGALSNRTALLSAQLDGKGIFGPR